MKTAAYIFFRFIEYYKDENNIVRQRLYSFIGIGALVVFNLITVKNVIDVLFDLHIAMFGLGENEYLNRLVIIPLLISPIFIILWIIYKKNKNTIEEYLAEFKTMSKEDKKDLNLFFWVYTVGTCLLFLLSLITPIFTRHT